LEAGEGGFSAPEPLATYTEGKVATSAASPQSPAAYYDRLVLAFTGGVEFTAERQWNTDTLKPLRPSNPDGP
jgi:hypothetical protein